MNEKQVLECAENFWKNYYEKNIPSLLAMMHSDICWSQGYCQSLLRGIDAVKEMLIEETKQSDTFVFKDIHLCDIHGHDGAWHVVYETSLDILQGEVKYPIQCYVHFTFVENQHQILLYEVKMSLYHSKEEMIEDIIKESAKQYNNSLQDIQYKDTLRFKQIHNDLEVLTNNVPGGIFKCLYNEELTILYMSEGFLSMFGYTRQEVKEYFHNSFWNMIVPEDREVTLEEVQRQMKLGKTKRIEYRVLHKDGHYVWVLDKGQLIDDPYGKCPSFYCIMIDVTQERKIEEELRLSLERYNIIMKQTNDIILEWDIVNDEIRFSNNWKDIFNHHIFDLDNGKLNDHEFKKFFHPQDVMKTDIIFNKICSGKDYIEEEIRLEDINHQYHWWKLRLTVQFDNNKTPLRAIGIMVDIDEEKRRSQYLLHKSQQDALTGIYNKITTQNFIKDYLSQMKSNEICAIMIIDIDNFKEINDSQGHLFGDAILSDIARKMKNSFQSTDIIGRIGGDEFVVFLKNVGCLEDVEKNAQRMIDEMELLEEHHSQLHISCSIGVSIAPRDGNVFTELFQKADRALYQAKSEGKKQYVIYDESIMHEHLFHIKPRSLISETIDSNDKNRLSGGQIAEYVFRVLYNTSDIENAVSTILEIIGLQFDVSRVYIFENTDNDLYCCNTFEWCNQGVEPQIDMLQHVSYVEDLGGNYIDNFNEDGIFYCSDIKSLPKLQYEILAPQGIKSMLQCAIKDNGVFKGYVGFDECRKNRYWTQEQIDVLVFISEILSIFLLKSRVETVLMQESQGLLNLLNNQSSWIYVINPDNYHLKFINDRTRELCPEATIGIPCYDVFMHRQTPCEFCPICKIQGGCVNHKTKIYNPYLKVWVDVDASYVKWQGEDAIMLSCHDITEYKQYMSHEK